MNQGGERDADRAIIDLLRAVMKSERTKPVGGDLKVATHETLGNLRRESQVGVETFNAESSVLLDQVYKKF